MGRIYYRTGRYHKANDALHQALRIREHSLGATHPDAAQVTSTTDTVKFVYMRLSHHSEVQILLLLRQTRAALAYLFTTLGNFSQAEQYYKV